MNRIKMSCVFLALVVFASFLFHFISQPPFLNYNDAALYAGVARNIVSGRGLTTDFVYPEYFRYTSPAEQGVWSSYWPPLHILCLAASFFVFGPTDKAAMYVTGIFFLLSVFLVYLLAKKAFDAQVAFLSALFYACTQEMLWYSTSGLSEPLFICLLLGCVLALYEGTRRTAIVAGICFALMYFTRTAALIYLPGIVFFLCVSRQRGKRLKAFAFFAVAVAVSAATVKGALSWCFGAGPSFHDTFFSPFFFNTDIYPGGQVMRTLDRVDGKLFIHAASSIVKKIVPNIGVVAESLSYRNGEMNYFNWIFTLMPPFLVLLFGASLWKSRYQRQQRSLRSAVLFLLGSVVFFNTLTITTPEMRYWHPFVPFLIIFAAEGLVRFSKMLPYAEFRRKFVLSGAVISLVAIFSIPEMAQNYFYNKESYGNKPGVYQRFARVFSEHTAPGETIVTNVDGWGSWYGRRRTVYYPVSPDGLAELQRYTSVDAVLIFSDLMFDEYSYTVWSPLIDRPHDFGDFVFQEIIAVPINEKETLKAALYKKRAAAGKGGLSHG